MTTSSPDQQLTPAYILHSRKYRDTSLILDLFSERDGRISAVLRGGRSAKGGAVQVFTSLLVSYYGRGELKTLSKVEKLNVPQISGKNLFIGMYVNELLVRLIGKFDVMPSLFQSYKALMHALEGPQISFDMLRQFELNLLTELGYGITFHLEAGTGKAIETACFYRFVPNQGFYLLSQETGEAYKGEYLLDLSKQNYQSIDVERSAKRIIRSSFNELLGGRPLKSRELLIQP